MIKQLAAQRGLETPQVCPGQWAQTRESWISQFSALQYGPIPPQPSILSWDQNGKDEPAGQGKGILKKMVLSGEQIHIAGRFHFPVEVLLPDQAGKAPFFVYLSFKPLSEDPFPVDQILSRGFAVLHICYTQVAGDDDDFVSGCAPVAGARGENSAGKLAIWAWAAMRALDFAQSLPQLDLSRAAVIGHSRLGKAALLAGACDTRFALVIANNSGCGGAAPYRGKQGETLRDITGRFPYWFCPSFARYAGREQELPFDQHQLVAACAPRRVLVGSALDDAWADPQAEFLSCVLADGVYRQLGLVGLVAPGRLPVPGDVWQDGLVGYHLRAGEHALKPEDWAVYMDAFEKI